MDWHLDPSTSLSNPSQLRRPQVVHGVPLGKAVSAEDAPLWAAVAFDICADPAWLLDGDGARRRYAYDVLDRIEWLETHFALASFDESRHGHAVTIAHAARRLNLVLRLPVLPDDDAEALANAASARGRHLQEVIYHRQLQTQAQYLELLDELRRNTEVTNRLRKELRGVARPKPKADPNAPTLVYFALWNTDRHRKKHWLKIGKTDSGTTPNGRITAHRRTRGPVFSDKDACVVELLGWTIGYEKEWHQRFEGQLVKGRTEEFHIIGTTKTFVDRLRRRDRTLLGEGIHLPPKET